MAPPLLDGMMSQGLLLTSNSQERKPGLEADAVWRLLLGLSERVATTGPFASPVGVRLDDSGKLVESSASSGVIALWPKRPQQWALRDGATTTIGPAAAQLLDIFVPLCVGPRAATMVLGHLAQSLDGRVATNAGASQFISGREDVEHTHRLRAFFDAVIVGARTVEHDDPRLTTRLVEGDHPTRVILDPTGRLRADYRVFQDDTAPTLLVRGRGLSPFASSGHTEVLELDLEDGWLPVPRVVDALAGRGLKRLFVEGGGITVSGFVDARAVDRLHLTVAPVLLGSGRPAIALPEISSLDEALRLRCRHFSLGPDMLFDCPLS